MRSGGMVEHYGTCSIWITDMATTSLPGWHMRIHLGMNFFVPNICVNFGRSERRDEAST
jgi:hypothetical protein